jgi:choline dehydrogenase
MSIYGTYEEIELATSANTVELDSGMVDYEYNPINTDGNTEEMTKFSRLGKKRARRWSVFEKLESRHYCRIRSFADCWGIMSMKCFLATAMLGIFVCVAVTFAHVLFFATEVGSVRFDYIIIGASPAGLLVAHDLVENGAKVLVLEAGNATQYEIGGKDFFAGPISRFDVPYLWPSLSTYPEYKWQGYENQYINLPKAVGGGGVMSPMTYLRAMKSDIEKWNIPNVTWECILDMYKRLEWYNGNNPPEYHGENGPIATSPSPPNVLGSLFEESTVASGVAKFSKDFNNPNENRDNKVGFYQNNIWRGIRDSAALQFLKPLLHNKNLVLETNARATKILLREVVVHDTDANSNKSQRPTEKRTIGVEFIEDGVLRTAYLRIALLPSKMQQQLDSYPRGVMLSGGSINNAQLLINSGIGPKDQIKHNKEVIIEGVGRNLQDHPVVGVMTAVDPALSAVLAPQGMSLFEELPGYISSIEESRTLWHKKIENTTNSYTISEPNYGDLGSPQLTTGAFLVSPFSLKTEDGPDIQINAYPSPIEPFKSLYSSYIEDKAEIFTDGTISLSENIKTQLKATKPLVLFTVTLLKPEVKQRVIVDKNHPEEAVFLEPDSDNDYKKIKDIKDNKNGTGNLSQRDQKRLAWGISQVRKILKEDPINQWIKEEVFPGANINNDEKLNDWVKKNAVPSNHWTGSCRMGRADDPLSVLDDRFQVYAIQDLRVVDASAMPTIVGANVGPTELALAKYASRIILEANTVSGTSETDVVDKSEWKKK